MLDLGLQLPGILLTAPIVQEWGPEVDFTHIYNPPGPVSPGAGGSCRRDTGRLLLSKFNFPLNIQNNNSLFQNLIEQSVVAEEVGTKQISKTLIFELKSVRPPHFRQVPCWALREDVAKPPPHCPQVPCLGYVGLNFGTVFQ